MPEMSNYQHILAVVDLTEDSFAVARRAVDIKKLFQFEYQRATARNHPRCCMWSNTCQWNH